MLAATGTTAAASLLLVLLFLGALLPVFKLWVCEGTALASYNFTLAAPGDCM